MSKYGSCGSRQLFVNLKVWGITALVVALPVGWIVDKSAAFARRGSRLAIEVAEGFRRSDGQTCQTEELFFKGTIGLD